MATGNHLKNFGQLSEPLKSSQEKLISLVPDSKGTLAELIASFPYQSFFDDTLLEEAILVQPSNQPLVFPDGKQNAATRNVACYGVGNSPYSKVPLAVRFLGGKAGAGSSVYILAPGQVVRPQGREGAEAEPFSGVQVGIPAGFLGGGRATYHILRTADAAVHYSTTPNEIPFHRQIIQIKDQGVALPAVTPGTKGLGPNWPAGFPWSQAFNKNGVNQRGQNLGRFTVTRTEIRVRVATVGDGSETLEIVMRGTDDFDTGADGVTVDTTVISAVKQLTMLPATYGGNTAFPVYDVGLWEPLNRLNGDQCRVDLISSTATLIGQFAEVTRYGRMG